MAAHRIKGQQISWATPCNKTLNRLLIKLKVYGLWMGREREREIA